MRSKCTKACIKRSTFSNKRIVIFSALLLLWKVDQVSFLLIPYVLFQFSKQEICKSFQELLFSLSRSKQWKVKKVFPLQKNHQPSPVGGAQGVRHITHKGHQRPRKSGGVPWGLRWDSLIGRSPHLLSNLEQVTSSVSPNPDLNESDTSYFTGCENWTQY